MGQLVGLLLRVLCLTWAPVKPGGKSVPDGLDERLLHDTRCLPPFYGADHDAPVVALARQVLSNRVPHHTFHKARVLLKNSDQGACWCLCSFSYRRRKVRTCGRREGSNLKQGNGRCVLCVAVQWEEFFVLIQHHLISSQLNSFHLRSFFSLPCLPLKVSQMRTVLSKLQLATMESSSRLLCCDDEKI